MFRFPFFLVNYRLCAVVQRYCSLSTVVKRVLLLYITLFIIDLFVYNRLFRQMNASFSWEAVKDLYWVA